MLSRITTTGPAFKAYRQTFTDEEFCQRVDESLAWAKENADSSKYFRPKKLLNKKFEKDAKGAFHTLEKFRQEFKKSSFEPFVTLSLEDKNLVGKIMYLNSTPVEVTTQLPCNIKAFFKRLKMSGVSQMQEDELNQKYWDLNEKLKYAEATQRARFKKLTSNTDEGAHPIILAFDNYYGILSEKIIKLTQEMNEVCANLSTVKSKLKNYQFKIKTKIKL